MNRRFRSAAIAFGLASTVVMVSPLASEVATRVEGESLSRPSGADQTIVVERPAGQLEWATSIDRQGRMTIDITDTRADDPGWSVVVSGGATSRTVVDHSREFAAADGTAYAQRVATGDGSVIAASLPGHGLGIARVAAVVSPGAEVTLI